MFKCLMRGIAFFHTLFIHFFPLNSTQLNSIYLFIFCASKNINTERPRAPTKFVGIEKSYRGTCAFSKRQNSAQHKIQYKMHEQIDKKAKKNKWIILVAIS